MKRDLQLIRDVLFVAEQGPGEVTEEGADQWLHCDAHTLKAHLDLLQEAGYVEYVDHSTLRSKKFRVLRLTWRGCEFLDAIRDERTWEFIVMKCGGASLPVDIIHRLALAFIVDTLGVPKELTTS